MAAWPGGFSSFQRGRANFSVLLLKNIYEASSLLPALVPRIWQEGEQCRNGESPLVRAFAYAHKQKERKPNRILSTGSIDPRVNCEVRVIFWPVHKCLLLHYSSRQIAIDDVSISNVGLWQRANKQLGKYSLGTLSSAGAQLQSGEEKSQKSQRGRLQVGSPPIPILPPASSMDLKVWKLFKEWWQARQL